ncbi:MAG: ABC transporter substrate-binding protein [Actinomycetota bacterium]
MQTDHPRPVGRLILLAAGLAVAACASGQSPATVTPSTTAVAPGTTAVAGFPVTVTAANGEVTIATQPNAIISLAPTTTEMVAAVGALDQLVAVDDQSDYPPGVPVTDLSGFTPNIEAIAAYQPDLVVVSNDIDGIVGALTSLEIPVILLPAPSSLEDVYAEIELVGAATGHLAEATALTSSIAQQVAEITGSVTPSDPPLTFYHELDPMLFSVTSSTFIGSVYTMVGLVNIADPADQDGFGYPQLSAEYIIESDPDLIFLADTECCGQSADTVAARPGWADLKAVTTSGVVTLSDDVASRWGPRVVDFLRAVAEAAAREPVA